MRVRVNLQLVALGGALMEAQRKVREVGGQNRGARIREYLAAAEVNVAAAWCAAFVQFCAVVAAGALGVPNPLEAVKLEALVQSYHVWGSNAGLLRTTAQVGDLVLFKFGDRWNHMGLVITPPDQDGRFRTVEGNTNTKGSREGDGVFLKDRNVNDQPTAFIRWAAAE